MAHIVRTSLLNEKGKFVMFWMLHSLLFFSCHEKQRTPKSSSFARHLGESHVIANKEYI